MKILVLSQYYSPDITAAAFRIKETVDLLRQQGCRVRVVTAKPHKARASETEERVLREEDVIRTPIFKYKGGGKWNYLAHYFSFMVNAIFAGIFRGGKADVVFVTSPPLFVGLSGWVVARAKGAKFVLDIRDIWPDSAVTTGQISERGALFRYAKVVEKWLYKKADLITCVAQPMADYISSFVPEKKIAIIYNGIPKAHLVTSGGIDKLSNDKINVVYVGNMGYCQALDLVLEAAISLKKSGDKRFQFHLIGGGVEKEKLIQKKDGFLLDNVIIDGPVCKEDAIQYIHNSSALFLQLKEDITMEKTIPSKVFDYMAGGKPILFGIEGEGKVLLGSIEGNIPFSSNNLQSFLDALERMADNYQNFAELALANRNIVEEGYTRESMVAKLYQELGDLI